MLDVDTFHDLLLDAGTRFGHQNFLIEDERLGNVPYTDLLCFAKGLERLFDELEIPLGAPVALLFHNCGLAAMLFLSVIAARRLLVPLNPASTTSELAEIFDRTKCAAVIADPAHTKLRNYSNRRQILISNHGKFFEEQCANGDLTSTWPLAASTQCPFVGEVVFTSGSTGIPKGILLSERSLIADAEALASVYSLGSSDRFLTVCPLFHNSGQVLTTLACALVGGSTAAVKSDVGMLNFWSYVDKYRANWSLGMVSFLALLLSRPEEPVQPTSMRGLLTGGSVIDAAMVHNFEVRFGVPVRTVYGLTETASISTCEFLDPRPRSLGSSGRPLPICDVRIGSELSTLAASDNPATHLQGEIWISGPNIFEAYVADPELTADRKYGRWLKTGDLGYFDENGNLFVIDRIDSMLIVGGENVYPAEVEKHCASLRDAAQIVLAGLDHPIWGKELVLVYKTFTGTRPPLSVWYRILAEQVAAIKVPQRYVAIQDLGFDDFPRKANGKLDRKALSALLRSRSSIFLEAKPSEGPHY